MAENLILSPFFQVLTLVIGKKGIYNPFGESSPFVFYTTGPYVLAVAFCKQSSFGIVIDETPRTLASTESTGTIVNCSDSQAQ